MDCQPLAGEEAEFTARVRAVVSIVNVCVEVDVVGTL